MKTTFEHPSSGAEVAYDTVRHAMQSEPYKMSLAGRDSEVVKKAVNQGIDARLEACNCPWRGDSFAHNPRMAGKHVLTVALDCVVSVESLPTLLRRLGEFEYTGKDDSDHDIATSLACAILSTLGINDTGKYVGREAMGLA